MRTATRPYDPAMAISAVLNRPRCAWKLPNPASVLMWRLGIGWSALAAVIDASTGKRIVLSGLVLVGPCLVLFTGRWLRTALAGLLAVVLVTFLGVPDGIWGSRRETVLIGLAALVTVACTLALVITFRAALSLAVGALLASCGSQGTPARRVVEPSARPVSCRSQYQEWANATRAVNTTMQESVTAVESAEAAGSPVRLRAAMRRLMPTALAAAATGGMPHCADPRALYSEYVTHVYQAGYDARSVTELNELIKSAAPLKDLTALQAQIAAEVRGILTASHPQPSAVATADSMP
jgi:hypothetical protein